MENRNMYLISHPPIISQQLPLPTRRGWGATSYEHSKEEWASLKPVIHDLYIAKNAKQKDIIPILKIKHNFKITPKQLTNRLKAWGFEKNVKRTARPNFGNALKRRGIRLPHEKIHHLKKGRTRNNGYHDPEVLLMPSTNAHEVIMSDFDARSFDSTGDILVQPSKGVDLESDSLNWPTSWNYVDVRKSPGLTRLFLHLKIGCEEGISNLELPPPSVPVPIMYPEYVTGSEVSDKSSDKIVTHFPEAKTSRGFVTNVSYASSSHTGRGTGSQVINSDFDSSFPRKISPCSSPSPLNEVYLFSSTAIAKLKKPRDFAPWQDVEEYAAKLSHLQRIGSLIFDNRSVGMIRRMIVLWRSLGTLRACREAEYWCQELSKCGCEQNQNSVVRLMDKLCFVEVIFKQKRLQKALAMIESIGEDLEWNGVPNDEVLLYFSSLKGGILGQLRDYTNQEKLYRDCLQQCLNTLGASHEETLNSMYRLSFPLRITGRIHQSEELLRNALYLGQKNHITLYTMLPTLGRVLYEQGQHQQAISLGKQALERSRGNNEGPFGSVQEDFRLSIRCIVQSYLREGRIRESIEAVEEYSDLGEKFVLLYHYLFLLGEIAESCQNSYEAKMLLSLLKRFNKKNCLDISLEESRKNIQILRDNSGNPDDLGYELWFINYLEKWYRKQEEEEEDEAAHYMREFLALEE